MNAGETVRVDCDGCGCEFEVCYEPKARDKPKEAKGIDPKKVTVCPFCGGDVNTEDDE